MNFHQNILKNYDIPMKPRKTQKAGKLAQATTQLANMQDEEKVGSKRCRKSTRCCSGVRIVPAMRCSSGALPQRHVAKAATATV